LFGQNTNFHLAFNDLTAARRSQEVRSTFKIPKSEPVHYVTKWLCFRCILSTEFFIHHLIGLNDWLYAML